MCEYRIYGRGPAQREPFDFLPKTFYEDFLLNHNGLPFLLR